MKAKRTRRTIQKVTLWVAFLIIGQTVFATKWVNTNVSVEGSFNAACFVNDSTVYAVGSGGSILKSVDGGITWSKTIDNSEVITSYYAVTFTSDSIGYAAGINGDMVKTTDTGKTWTSLKQSFQTNYTYGMSFPSKLIGYQVGYGGVIIKTTDAGTTWTKQTSGLTTHLRSVCFLNDTLGYACGLSGKMLKTTNGGTTWTAITQSLVTGSLYCITFSTADSGYVVGASGAILKTTNGGVSWTKQTSPVTTTLYSAFIVNDTTVYAAGNSGVVLKTTDGGTNWTKESTDATSILYFVACNKSGTKAVSGGALNFLGKQQLLSLSKSTLSINHGAAFDSTYINSNTSWTATTKASWITLNANSGAGDKKLIVSAMENTTTTSRVDSVIVASGTDSLKIIVTQAAGTPTVLAETPGDVTLTMYPNPVSSSLTIQTALPIQGVIVTDLSGNVVVTGKTATVEMSRLSKGLYLVQVRTEKGVTTKKISKE
jgi:photosystem II stability/assembly factor-like uncharacterized protein